MTSLWLILDENRFGGRRIQIFDIWADLRHIKILLDLYLVLAEFVYEFIEEGRGYFLRFSACFCYHPIGKESDKLGVMLDQAYGNGS